MSPNQHKNKQKRPVVGVLCNRRYVGFDRFTFDTTYLFTSNTTCMLESVGAVPVLIPVVKHDDMTEVLDRLDGLCFTGGSSNVWPELYGHAPTLDHQRSDARDVTAFSLIKKALEKDMPFLGLCRGLQELNVALGGTLHQNLESISSVRHQMERKRPAINQTSYIAPWQNQGDPSESDGRAQPTPDASVDLPTHSVTLTPGGLLARWVGEPSVTVNSEHNQAIDQLGKGLRVEAISSEDGFVEAVSLSERRFVVGVQWHPEGPYSRHLPLNRALFSRFGQAVRDYAR